MLYFLSLKPFISTNSILSQYHYNINVFKVKYFTKNIFKLFLDMELFLLIFMMFSVLLLSQNDIQNKKENN